MCKNAFDLEYAENAFDCNFYSEFNIILIFNT